jgi:hypothetical protein
MARPKTIKRKLKIPPGNNIVLNLKVPIVKLPLRQPHCCTYHPKHGLVYITGGAYEVMGRLSNHWHWRKVLRVNGKYQLTGPTFTGYGFEFDKAEQPTQVEAVNAHA